MRIALRRRLFAFALVCGAATMTQASAAPLVEVWVELSEPPAAAQERASASANRRAKLAAQQDAVAASLRGLGAVELARVRHTGNAIAVRIDADRLDAVRSIPGVKRVRPARQLHPPKPGS